MRFCMMSVMQPFVFRVLVGETIAAFDIADAHCAGFDGIPA